MNTTLTEKLSKKQPVSVWIRDFIDSTNPKFEGKTKKERIAMALGAYYAAQKNEEYGAGFEGTDELRKKYIQDTPGQRIQQFKTEMNQQTYKTYQEFEAQHQKMYPYHNKDQIQAAWETYSKYFEMEEAEGKTVESVYNDLSKMSDSALRGILRRMDHPDFNDIKDQRREDIIAEILMFKFGEKEALEFLENPDNFKMEEDDNKMIKVTGIETDLDPTESQWKMAVATQRENGVKLAFSGYHEFSISGPFKKVRAAVIRHYGDANEAEKMHPQIKTSMSEDSVQESRDFKSFSRENLILWLQTNWTGKKVSPQFRQELDAAVREAQSRGLYKNIKIEPQKTDAIQERIDIRDYMATSEKSQFGGYRPHVVNKEGKTMYLAAASYNTPDEAKAHAEEYLKQYARGISEPRVPIKGTYGLKEEKESYDSWIIKPREGPGDGVKVKAPDETSAIEIALGRKPSQNEIDFFNFHYILIQEKTNVSILRNMKIVELATKCYDSDLVKEYVEQHYKSKTSALEIKESFRSFVSNKTII